MEIPKNMCVEYRKKVADAKTNKELIDYYKTIPNWCLENKYPALEVLKEYNGIDDGFHVDCDVDVVADKQTYVFNNCKGIVRTKFNVDDPFFPMLYFGLGCNMELVVDGGRCTVELYDTSDVDIKEINGGICTVYNYKK